MNLADYGVSGLHANLDVGATSFDQSYVFHPGSYPRNRFDTSVVIPARALAQLQVKVNAPAATVVDANGAITAGTYYYEVDVVKDLPITKNTMMPAGYPMVYSNDANYPAFGKEIDVPAGGYLRRIVIMALDNTATAPLRKDDQITGVKLYMPKSSKVVIESNWEELKAATVTITVNAVNDAPGAADDSKSTNEDMVLTLAAPGVLSNDSDMESNPLTAIKVTDPQHGSITLNSDGSFTYTPDDDYNGIDYFTYKANDGTLDSNIAKVTITVRAVNAVPALGPITAPVNPIPVRTNINASAIFTDPDSGDAYNAIWEWGDGSSSTGEVDTEGGSVLGDHTYTTPSVYTIRLMLKDNAGAEAQSCFSYVVVYDQSAGFVTGGGWITSPCGAYVSQASLTGQATFGFVAKYVKGASTPVGNTEFQFQVAGMNFQSHSYQWLVIAGEKAQFKGTGTINGVGEYCFMLTAIDSQIKGESSMDMFRIKIWDRVSEQVVYDNKLGESENSDSATELCGGSIVIHSK